MVLVFVNQHVAQRVLPLGAHFFVAQQQLVRQADQVVEVNCLERGQALLITLHHARCDLLVCVARGSLRLLAVQALVFPQADRPLPAPRQRVVGAGTGVFQDGEHVIAVENAELLFQANAAAIDPQNAHAERVKGADDEVLGRTRADQFLGALAHLLRGLVGERDRGDLPRRITGLQQPRDLVRDDARFARAGTSKHQARPAEVVNGFELGGVQRRRG
jgi:hypothetical protein